MANTNDYTEEINQALDTSIDNLTAAGGNLQDIIELLISAKSRWKIRPASMVGDTEWVYKVVTQIREDLFDFDEHRSNREMCDKE